MEQLSNYNDIEFSNLFYKYHPDDNSLRCENNIIYYQGETKFYAGRCGVKKGECVNLGYFRVGLIDIPVWRLDPDALFFLIREYVNSIYSVINIDSSLESIDKIVKNPNPKDTEIDLLDRFMDYYNSLKMFKPYLRDELKENFEAISNYIKSLLSGISLVTRGYKMVNDKFFEYVKANGYDESIESSGGKGVARQLRNTTYKTKPTSISQYYEATDYDSNILSKDAFTTLLTIIFLIIATIAVVLTLIFL